MKITRSVKVLLVAVACFCCISAVRGQKLPDSQEQGIRAPQNVKIDGKAVEWGTLQAFSHKTDVSYTLANDDSTLYLVVQSNISSIVTKIIGAGITLTINTAGKKKEKEGVSVTFPWIPPPIPRAVRGVGGGGETVVAVYGSGTSSAPRSETAAMRKRRDSLTFINNNRKIEKFKDVCVTGIPAIKDTLLSIYNEEGIKARCTYQETGLYTYELAIPLKYLAINVRSPKEFLFNLKLNGKVLGGMPPGAQLIVADGAQSTAMTTDFWGKYLVVAK